MPKRLCVYVPGLSGSVAEWDPLVARLGAEPELQDTLWFPYPHRCKPFGRRRLIDAAVDLASAVDTKWVNHGPFDEIILIGHSLGGLVVRQAYLLAAGIYPDRAIDSKWHAAVTRIVLMAAPNRGLDPTRTARLRAANRVAKFIVWRDTPMKEMLRGSDFITELRLQWIRHFRQSARPPLVVQLLGTEDAEVHVDDSVDVVQFPGAGHLRVPGMDHFRLPFPKEGEEGDEHYGLIRRAVVGRFEEDVVPPPPPERTVVFLMHGIRAYSVGWVTKLKGEVVAEAQRVSRPVEVVAPQRYLSALQFTVPWLHAKLVRWFQDEYSEHFAREPNARFVFAGHSNGTYLLGRSLEPIPAMRFDRVYLAGSVLPTRYDWRERFGRRQVERVRNDCTTGDVPVGVLCRVLSWVGRNVGTAGVHGFDHPDDRVKNYRYFRGGHGRVLNDGDNRKTVVGFLLHGEIIPDPPSLRPGIPLWVDWLQKLSSVLIIAAVLAGIYYAVVAFPVGVLLLAGGLIGLAVILALL